MFQDIAAREWGRAEHVLSGPLLSYSNMLAAGNSSYEYLRILLSADTPLFDEKILDPLSRSLQHSLVTAFKLVYCLGELLFFSAIFVLKLLVLAFPHLLRLINVVIDFHKTQLSKWDILVECSLITILVLFLIFRTRIALFWLRFQKRVGKRYRVAARHAPHVLFFLVASIFAIVGRKLLAPVCASPAMPLLIIAYPLYQTIRCINERRALGSIESLKYWIVVTLYFATKRLVMLVPFSSFFYQYTYVIQVMVLIVAVWIQVSSTCVDIVFDAVTPILTYYVEKIPVANFGSNYGNAVLNGLQFARLISVKNAVFLQNLLGDTVLVLICAVFSFTPTYLATLGVVSIVMILPAFKSSKLILLLVNSSDAQQQSQVDEHVFWLKYWCCFAGMITLECFGIYMWCIVAMVLFSWLQHSYFCGANKVFAFVLKEVAALSDHHAKVQSAKKVATAEIEHSKVEASDENKSEVTGEMDKTVIDSKIISATPANDKLSVEMVTPDCSAVIIGSGLGNASDEIDFTTPPSEKRRKINNAGSGKRKKNV